MYSDPAEIWHPWVFGGSKSWTRIFFSFYSELNIYTRFMSNWIVHIIKVKVSHNNIHIIIRKFRVRGCGYVWVPFLKSRKVFAWGAQIFELNVPYYRAVQSRACSSESHARSEIICTPSSTCGFTFLKVTCGPGVEESRLYETGTLAALLCNICDTYRIRYF